MLTTVLDFLGLLALAAAVLLAGLLLLGLWGLAGGLCLVAVLSLGGSWLVDRVRK